MLVLVAMLVVVCISNSLVLTSGRHVWSSVNSPECMDCVQVNQSMDIKVFGGFRFPEPDCFGKLLVYECVADDICGGLADRQKGVISAFLLALLTNRTFILNHRKSCAMKKIMPPRVYNWFKCMPYLYRYEYKGQHIVKYIDNKGNLPRNFSVLRSGDLWSEHIVKLHVNTRFNVAIKEHPDAKRMLPWLFKASEQDILTGLLKVLFKPGESLQNHLDTFLRTHTINGSRKLVAVHIRTFFLNKETDVPVFFKFLTQFTDISKFVIYFATDDIDVRRQAEKRFFNFVSLNNSIVHINRDCEGMYTAVFEQHILANSDVLVLSNSGFSRIAAFIRASSENIYLFTYRSQLDEAHFEPVTLGDLVMRFPAS